MTVPAFSIEDRLAAARELREQAERLALPPIASGANIHRVAGVRTHLLLVADQLVEWAGAEKERRRAGSVIAAIGRFLVLLGAALEADVFENDQREAVREAGEACGVLLARLVAGQ